MKTVKRLNIQDKPGYFFKNININDFDLESLLINDSIVFRNGSVMYDIVCCEKENMPHIVFNNIECIFRKTGKFSY